MERFRLHNAHRTSNSAETSVPSDCTSDLNAQSERGTPPTWGSHHQKSPKKRRVDVNHSGTATYASQLAHDAILGNQPSTSAPKASSRPQSQLKGKEKVFHNDLPPVQEKAQDVGDSASTSKDQSCQRYDIQRIPDTLKIRLTKKIDVADDPKRSSKTALHDELVHTSGDSYTHHHHGKFDPESQASSSIPTLHRPPKNAEQEAMARDVMRLYQIANGSHVGTMPIKSEQGQSSQADHTAAATSVCNDDQTPTTETQNRAHLRRKLRQSTTSTSASRCVSHQPHTNPPLWSCTNLQDISSVNPLCPGISKQGGDVHVRLSDGGKVARGILLTGGQGCIDEKGRFEFEMAVRNTLKRVPNEGATSGVKVEAKSDPSVVSTAAGQKPSSNNAVHIKFESEDEAERSPLTASSCSYTTPSSPTETLLTLTERDPIISGLLQAYIHRTPVYVFLSGRPSCHQANGCFCVGGNCGALSLLPCTISNTCVKAVAVGWAFLQSIESLGNDGKRLKLSMRIVKEHGETSYWWEANKRHTRFKAEWPLRLEFQHAEHSAMGKPSARRSALCPQCSCVIPHILWKHWECPYCKYTINTSPVVTASAVDALRGGGGVAPPPIAGETEPRMDSGRAIFDEHFVKRVVTTWNDQGIKCAQYTVEATQSHNEVKFEGTGQQHQNSIPSLRLWHFLANGKDRAESDDLVESLLDAGSPLQRSSIDEPFSISMRLCEDPREKQGEAAFKPPLIPSRFLDPTLKPNASLASTLLDTVERIESLIVLASLESQAQLSTAQLILNHTEGPRKHQELQLQGSPRIAYTHLGANAHLAISRRDPLNPRKKQTVLNALVGHGDVLLVLLLGDDDADDRSASSPWSVGVDCVHSCVNVICV